MTRLRDRTNKHEARRHRRRLLFVVLYAPTSSSAMRGRVHVASYEHNNKSPFRLKKTKRSEICTDRVGKQNAR